MSNARVALGLPSRTRDWLARSFRRILPHVATVVVGPLTGAGTEITLSYLHGTVEREEGSQERRAA
jgi:hypothetical protein